MPKSILVQDNDCHWYVIPAIKLNEWSIWGALNPDDPKSWDAPEWAEQVGGAPCRVKFDNWEIS